VAALPGFGMATAIGLIEAIASARNADSFQFVTALGISGVGTKTVKRLSRHFMSLTHLLTTEHDQMVTLTAAEGRAVNTIRSFFITPGGAELLREFREQGIMCSLS